MGRFYAARVIVREIDELQFIFWDKHSIYVECFKQRYVFHRWYAPKGSYNEWRKFRHLLLHRRHLTLRNVFELADKYGILSKCAVGRLQWKGKPVEIRFGNIKILGISNDVQDVLRE